MWLVCWQTIHMECQVLFLEIRFIHMLQNLLYGTVSLGDYRKHIQILPTIYIIPLLHMKTEVGSALALVHGPGGVTMHPPKDPPGVV